MEDFRSKQKIRKRLYSRATFFVLLLVTVLLLKGVWGAWDKHRESKQNLKNVEQELVQARNRELELTTRIEKLETQEGMEKEIRERFSVTKPGEEIVLIVEEDTSSGAYKAEDLPWWKKVGRWFASLSDEE